ncbi:MAG TPA: hypothetical protein PLB02_00300 [Thermoanaerobaculia bacterium]|nr:hypothetical protein [Thermoanaerobaculia bacterium]HQR65820.1 hypothetical protein [Thermoanaerobaculia bacterium]
MNSRIRLLVAAAALSLAGHVRAGEPPDPLRFSRGNWEVKLGAVGGLGAAGESRAFWNVVAGVDPSYPYDPNRIWGEYWLFPGVTATFKTGSAGTFYGGLSVGVTGNIGSDLYQTPANGRAAIENLYLGWRHRGASSGLEIDLSGGAQNYSVGTGFLLFQGAQNGGVRGATYAAPRTAWDMTGVARLRWKSLSADGFFLQYNQISGQPATQLAGGKLEVALGESQSAGVAYVDAIASTMPYVQATETILASGRKGTRTAHLWATVRPLPKALPDLSLSGEFAWQRNGRIDMKAWAAAGTASCAFSKTGWKPTLSVTYAYFTGDDPATPAFEGFDPLFWNAGLANWATGGNGAFAWAPSNLVMYRVHAGAAPSAADTLDLFWFHISAARTDSPLALGQDLVSALAQGIPVTSVGVPTRHLNDGFAVQWQRSLGTRWTLTACLNFSAPGAGLSAVSNGTATTWVGGNLSAAFSY